MNKTKSEVEKFISLVSSELILIDPIARRALDTVRAGGMTAENAMAKALKESFRDKLDMESRHEARLRAISEQRSIRDFGAVVDIKGLMLELKESADTLEEVGYTADRYAHHAGVDGSGCRDKCINKAQGIRELLEGYGYI